MTISGATTEQLDIFCHVTGFTSDFLSFIVVEVIRFFCGAIQLLLCMFAVYSSVIFLTVHCLCKVCVAHQMTLTLRCTSSLDRQVLKGPNS